MGLNYAREPYPIYLTSDPPPVTPLPTPTDEPTPTPGPIAGVVTVQGAGWGTLRQEALVDEDSPYSGCFTFARIQALHSVSSAVIPYPTNPPFTQRYDALMGPEGLTNTDGITITTDVAMATETTVRP